MWPLQRLERHVKVAHSPRRISAVGVKRGSWRRCWERGGCGGTQAARGPSGPSTRLCFPLSGKEVIVWWTEAWVSPMFLQDGSGWCHLENRFPQRKDKNLGLTESALEFGLPKTWLVIYTYCSGWGKTHPSLHEDTCSRQPGAAV